MGTIKSSGGIAIQASTNRYTAPDNRQRSFENA